MASLRLEQHTKTTAVSEAAQSKTLLPYRRSVNREVVRVVCKTDLWEKKEAAMHDHDMQGRQGVGVHDDSAAVANVPAMQGVFGAFP